MVLRGRGEGLGAPLPKTLELMCKGQLGEGRKICAGRNISLNRRIGRLIDRRIDILIDRRVDILIDRWIDILIDRWIDILIDRWIDLLIDRRIDL